MTQDVVLEHLYRRYRAAIDAWRPASVDLTAVDELLAARVVLFEHLARTGWQPPEQVRRQLELDALLLEQPPTALPG